MTPTNCPSCGHPVGDPVMPGHRGVAKIDSSKIMICIKCFEWMRGEDVGTLRILTPRERAYLLVHRGEEMIRMMRLCAMAADIDQRAKQ